MKSAMVPKALSHLYLHAVLPSLAELVRHDEIARTIILPWYLSLSIGVVGEEPVILAMKKGEMTFSTQSVSKPDVRLLFLTDRHLNAFFNGKKWALPFVTRGLWRVGFLKSFAALTQRLTAILTDNTSRSPLYTRLVFFIGGLGILPLVKFDPFSQSVLKKTPQGLAEFSVADHTIEPIWFNHQGQRSLSGKGHAPRKPDVSVRFSDIMVANAALRNDLDTMAAIGAQRISIEGLAPLADALGLIMERLNVYLAR